MAREPAVSLEDLQCPRCRTSFRVVYEWQAAEHLVAGRVPCPTAGCGGAVRLTYPLSASRFRVERPAEV